MRWSHYVSACVLLTALAVTASAGIIFKKQPKPKPEERVPELIAAVKTEPDEHKRASAAAELRQYDPRAFPDLVPVLADVLRNDAKTKVRLEALQSLSRIRPVSQEAGLALEHAAANDPALRVRVQAKKSLLYYRLSGYHSPGKKEPAPGKPADAAKDGPPLTPQAAPPNPGRAAKRKPSGPVLPPSTAEPPLADPLPDHTVGRPMPPGPVKPPAPTTPPAKEEGPDLGPF
jgi:hypothetical protein